MRLPPNARRCPNPQRPTIADSVIWKEAAPRRPTALVGCEGSVVASFLSDRAATGHLRPGGFTRQRRGLFSLATA